MTSTLYQKRSSRWIAASALLSLAFVTACPASRLPGTVPSPVTPAATPVAGPTGATGPTGAPGLPGSPAPTAPAATPLATPVPVLPGPVADLTVSSDGKLRATFNRPMNSATLTSDTFTLFSGANRIPGTVTGSGTTAQFAPQAPLPTSTTFTVTITTGAKDLAGLGLNQDVSWTFATAANGTAGAPTVSAGDQAAPAITAVTPGAGATGVPLNPKLMATFNRPMDPETVTAATVSLMQGTTPVAGAVSYANITGTFTPTSDLAPNTTYTATVTSGAKDLAGKGLAANRVWSFTTGLTAASPAPAGQGIAFGATLSRYAVLAGSTVTNTGPTIVNGDLGVSPGSFVTGFGPGTVNGQTHAGDDTAAQAKQELTAAYNDAVGRSTAPVSVAGNLGGMTLTPGLYTSNSSLAISSGDLTFDAQGNPDAVFVIQMASSLTTTSGRQVILAGGAKAANIFWQVGSSATLGTNSVFKGNILAAISITLETGASLQGRALTQTGAVALDSNTITI